MTSSKSDASRRASNRIVWTGFGAGVAVVAVVILVLAFSPGSATMPPIVSGAVSGTPTATASPAGDVLWQDDFNGARGSSASSQNWSYAQGGGGWGNDELQTYTQQNAVLDGKSHLVISAVVDPDAKSGSQYTSARLTSTGSFQYGRLTARIKIPDGTGLLPAFWLLGADLPTVGYPASGEIDVVETPFGTSSTTHSVHGPSTTNLFQQAQRGIDVTHDPALSAAFHEYWVDRSPGRIAIGIDETTTAIFTPATTPGMDWVFDKPFQTLFSLAIGGQWPGSPDTSAASTSRMVIDWIKLQKN
jgi:beta-glucanase (GH16 family)